MCLYTLGVDRIYRAIQIQLNALKQFNWFDSAKDFLADGERSLADDKRMGLERVKVWGRKFVGTGGEYWFSLVENMGCTEVELGVVDAQNEKQAVIAIDDQSRATTVVSMQRAIYPKTLPLVSVRGKKIKRHPLTSDQRT